jgi:hypothetical protein
MNFKDYIKEAAAKAKKPEKPEETTAVMAFGRMNPPTIGHEKLINKLQNISSDHKGEAHLFTSHSQGTAKDPLDQKTKIGYLHSIVPGGMQVHGSTREKPTFLHAAAKLYAQGHKHLVMVAGSDRVDEYRERLEKYNDGKEHAHGKYKFKSIKVVSAGQRDPDAEGVEGMSGTKMRDHARGNRIDKFKTGLPDVLKAHAQEIANHIRTVKVKGVDIKEDYENPYRFDDATPEGTEYMKKMTPGQKIECVTGVWSEKLGTCVSVREAYIQNEIFKLNDVVEAMNGDRGPIVFRGSAYVTIQLKEGKAVKHWLKDIQESSTKETIVATKPVRKIIENKTPALFMSKKQLEEMNNNRMELEYNGYQTDNLHMCPGASVQLKELIKRTDLNPTYILQAVQASDQYLGIEKEAKEIGFANDQMVHDFNMKLAIAHDTLNMLGYPDKDLMYMANHIQDMAKLAMHKDGTFANETQSTVPTFGSEDTSESYIPNVKETITMSNLRKRIAEMTDKVSTPLDPPTVSRDINLSGSKEVYHGIDHTIDLQNFEGKHLGLVSFKSFLATPETDKIEKEKGQAMQDVHRAKAELSTHSSAYRQMTKAHIQDN